MSELRLALLGRPLVTYHHSPLTGWALQKSLALLAYLAVTGQPHSREALAGLLWPDCSEADARGNLRKVVAELGRRVPAHLVTTRAEMAFDRSAPYWLDVHAFERSIYDLLAAGRSVSNPPAGVSVSGVVSAAGKPLPMELRSLLPDTGLNPTSAVILAEAIELYRGGFLSGLAVRRAPDFEQWVLIEQEHLQGLLLQALQALARYHAVERPGIALEYLDRLLALEPAQEEAHQLKMWLLGASGQRLAALRQYSACCQALQTLGAQPDARTVALYERIRAGVGLPVLLHAPTPPRSLPYRLPVPLLPLIGREAELSEIRARLRSPEGRLLTVVGPAGCGKTHLALEAVSEVPMMPDLSPNLAGSQENAFVDDAYFVPLASVAGVDALETVLARALDAPLGRPTLRRQALLAAGHDRRCLLVLDGFEHLLAGAGLVVDLLEAAPSLKILVTSRARLDVPGEHLLSIRGLPYPEPVLANCELLAAFASIRLFVTGARQIRPGLEVAGGELLDVARICHRVGGLPLALLLAASWIGMLTPAEIAAELGAGGSRGLDLLAREDGMLPARQRSMRAAYDRSWDLLSPRERQVLAGLSVLPGGFTTEEAGRVAGASLRDLRALVNWSLLRRQASGRYAMGELLRQYAEEKLART